MVELCIVLGVCLILGAIAIPNMIAVISNARLHAGVTSMSGLLQNAQMVAVKTNRTLTTHFGTINGHTLVGWVKTAADTSPRVSTDLQAEWEAPVMMMASPTGVGAPSVISTTVLGFTPETTEPSFNTRGLPCVYSGGSCANHGFL